MTDRHAGFAAALAISAGTLDDLTRAMYFANQFAHAFSGSAPALSGGPVVAFDDLFLLPPRVVLSAANNGRVGLALSGWGPVRVVPAAPQAQESHSAFFDALVLIAARAVVVNGRMALLFDVTTASVASLTVRPFMGSEFSPAAQSRLDSAGLRAQFEFSIQQQLGSGLPSFPPFDVSFLGPIATDPSTRATLVVTDGALLLGFDVASGAVTTTGNPAQLTNFLAGHDIAMWTNPAALPLVFSGLLGSLSSPDFTLTSLTLTPEDGGIRVAGTAGNAAGTATFSARAEPFFMRLGSPARDRLSVRIVDFQVSIQEAWWVVLIEIFTAGLGRLVVEFFSTFIRSNVINSVQLSPPGTIAPLEQRFSLPGIAEPVMTLKITTFESHTEGLFAGMLLDVPFRGPRIEGPAELAAEELYQPGAFVQDCRLRLGEFVQPDDPTLRARWTVRISGAPTTLLVQDRPLRAGGWRLLLPPSAIPFLSAQLFRIECRLYRVAGQETTSLFNGVHTITVRDRLDRTLPYVRWVHQVLVPVVRVEADGSRTLVTQAVKTRYSRIHKTAIPGRCRMASKYSRSWIISRTPQETSRLEYLADLPFAPASIDRQRPAVCDYCFYGGPTRTVPLLP